MTARHLSSSSSRVRTGDVDPQWCNNDCCIYWVFSLLLKSWCSLWWSRISTGRRFHSCGEETEKPLRPDRSFRNRGTRSWTWDDDRRLRLAGMSFTEWQSSVKYSGARPARQLLVMELSLKWTRKRIGSQWRSRRIADEIGSYLPILILFDIAAQPILEYRWIDSYSQQSLRTQFKVATVYSIHTQSLSWCSTGLVPNVLPRRDEGSGKPCAVDRAS